MSSRPFVSFVFHLKKQSQKTVSKNPQKSSEMLKNCQKFTKTMSEFVFRIWYLPFGCAQGRLKTYRQGMSIFICKTNPICRPPAGNPKLEALNSKQRHDFAKQSQSTPKGVEVAIPAEGRSNLYIFYHKLTFFV